MRTSRGLWRVLALLLAFTLVAAACGDDGDDGGDSASDDSGSDEGDEAVEADFDTESLTIGTLLPETGQLAFLGPPMVEGVNMAIRDINDAGGVLDTDVTLVTGDDGTDPDVANQTVDRLVGSEGVNAIVGAAASSITRQVVDKITGAGILQCSGSNTAADLSGAGQDGLYYRTAPSDDLQGPTLGEYVIDDGLSNIAVLVRSDEYGVGFGDSVVAALEDGGATVVYHESYDPAATNFDAEIQAISAENPDAIVLISFEEGVQVIQAMIEAGIGPDTQPIYIADGLATGDLGELIDPEDPTVAFGIRGSQPSAAPENGAAFFPEEFATFAPDVDAIYSAQVYDCVVTMALTAQAAGAADPAAMRDALEDVTSGGTKCTTFAECKELLDAGEDIDYDGASGPLDFDGSDPTIGTYDLFVYGEDGAQEVLRQVVAEL
jgi:branched-chain amino acid transport system substrate-binding protein